MPLVAILEYMHAQFTCYTYGVAHENHAHTQVYSDHFVTGTLSKLYMIPHILTSPAPSQTFGYIHGPTLYWHLLQSTELKRKLAYLGEI